MDPLLKFFKYMLYSISLFTPLFNWYIRFIYQCWHVRQYFFLTSIQSCLIRWHQYICICITNDTTSLFIVSIVSFWDCTSDVIRCDISTSCVWVVLNLSFICVVTFLDVKSFAIAGYQTCLTGLFWLLRVTHKYTRIAQIYPDNGVWW